MVKLIQHAVKLSAVVQRHAVRILPVLQYHSTEFLKLHQLGFASKIMYALQPIMHALETRQNPAIIQLNVAMVTSVRQQVQNRMLMEYVDNVVTLDVVDSLDLHVVLGRHALDLKEAQRRPLELALHAHHLVTFVVEI
jgi:hypothetical protein